MSTQLEHCRICKRNVEDDSHYTIITQKGAAGINQSSQMRRDTVVVTAGQKVHELCRKNYTHRRNIDNDTQRRKDEWLAKISTAKCELRSSTSQFRFNECCLFCGCPVDLSASHRKGSDVFCVRTIDFDKTIKETCELRNDDWAVSVYRRICTVPDLHAADAVYHQLCSNNFRTSRGIPFKYENMNCEPEKKRRRSGRPEDEVKTDAFIKAMQFLERNDEEQTTVSDVVQKMRDALEVDVEPYSNVYMKKKILEHFGTRILISTVDGKSNVVTFTDTASSILNQYHVEARSADPEKEKAQLLCAAAKLLKNDIKGLQTNKDDYDVLEKLSTTSEAVNFVPDSLRLFLREIFVGKTVDLKIASIGHAIIQAARPQAVIAPLQIGLGVQMHHHFASRYLIDTLNAMGFCSSYYEVRRFERCSAISAVEDLDEILPGGFIHHVADNVDHDICTLDGNNTFHGMGIIASVTPASTSARIRIPRINPTADDIRNAQKIRIVHHKSDDSILSRIRYEGLRDFQPVVNSTLEILWHSSWYLKTPRPGWNATQQALMVGNHPGKSSIVFLPMIDLPASDDTCIYSTLLFIVDQAMRHGFTPVVTFDQPLWWKAMKMVEAASPGSALSKVVLKLGGFHIMMSFLGAVGYIMDGSGLREVLEHVYAPNTVPHLLSGKAIARAVRGHLLIDAALHAILLSEVFADNQASDDEPRLQSEEIVELRNLYEKLMNKEVVTEVAEGNPSLEKIQEFISRKRKELLQCRTSKLWFQYLDMVAILRNFVKGERSGSWELHLKSTSDMLPYLAAAGHNHYTKSCHLYLQRMDKLQDTHPTVYQAFQSGMHVVRRSDRFWAGLSTDLVIEQELMRSLKTCGGLTNGSGMTEAQRSLWVLSRPVCSTVNLLMERISQILYVTSDQHKEMSEPMQLRDCKDTQTIIEFLERGSPFEGDVQLRSIANGLTAYPSANVDSAKDVGLKVIDAMSGQVVSDFVFRRKEQAIQMTTKQSPSGDCKRLDPTLLFQRFIMIAKRINLTETEYFQHELCSYPASLFDSSCMLRTANKPELAKAIAQACNLEKHSFPLPEGTRYILNGGALLHRIPWTKNERYLEILDHYATYVTGKYPSATIVFDGYDGGASIKDMAHSLRSRTVGREIFFTADMQLKLKKEEFLSCKKNKARFICALADHLRAKGVSVSQASGDADVPIVEAAVASSRYHDTAVVGDDTDLLVLLCYHCDLSSKKLFFAPEPKSNKAPRIWDIHTLKEKLGQDTCHLILFAHALLGCDSTSRIHGVGKGLALKRLIEDNDFRTSAAVFMQKSASKEEIKTAGEDALLIIYGSSKGGSLNKLRREVFEKKVTTANSFVHPEHLPPTSDAAKFHSYRVFYQVQVWTGEPDPELKAEEWGWKNKDDFLYPLTTDLPPAPRMLLKIVKCSCRVQCSSARCSCFKNGLVCTSACRTCKGTMCSNSPKIDSNNDEENLEP